MQLKGDSKLLSMKGNKTEETETLEGVKVLEGA